MSEEQTTNICQAMPNTVVTPGYANEFNTFRSLARSLLSACSAPRGLGGKLLRQVKNALHSLQHVAWRKLETSVKRQVCLSCALLVALGNLQKVLAQRLGVPFIAPHPTQKKDPLEEDSTHTLLSLAVLFKRSDAEHHWPHAPKNLAKRPYSFTSSSFSAAW